MRIHTVTVIDYSGAKPRRVLDCNYDYNGEVALAKQTKAATEATAAAPTYGKTAQAASGTLLPAYQSIVANPGYSAADKANITQSTLGGVGATFGGARDAATNRVARTGNTAGYGASMDDLARSQAQQTATSEAGLGEKFADTALSERDKALSGLSNLYGTSGDLMAKLYGVGTSTYTPAWQSILQSGLAAGGAVGAAALKGQGGGGAAAA